ncbi:type I-E CRISPR-associated protein Cse1/CasA [Streptomyces sp. NPDC006703]|uniref:type I-E CRISPR-associated protein Cse1/CasA n=1 Tax=Streptomyces sp. NPDC006703 TaxID=3364759 RepID=UPI00369FB0CF
MNDLSFSLGRDPWLPVRDLAGIRELVSGPEALGRAEQLVLDIADPLQSAAVLRFLTAVAYAAGLAPADPGEYAWRCVEAASTNWSKAGAWLEEHAEGTALFHPERPLYQDASLHQVKVKCTVPVHYLDLTAAAALGRPLLADHRHLHVRLPALPPDRAARLLLTQQMWAVGGRLRASGADYGPGSNYGSQAPACGGLVWQPHGTLATQLAWRTIPVTELDEANWTHRPRGTATQPPAPLGELDALTWLPRRILLLPTPDGLVERAHCVQGWKRTTEEPGQPGTADRIFTATGKKLPATAPLTPLDTVSLVERWWHAGPGTLPHLIRDACALTGCAPPAMRAVGLATDKKKVLVLRDVPLPSEVLAAPAAGEAAAWIAALRWKTRSSAGAWEDGCGTTLLTDPAFLEGDQAERARLAARAFRIHAALPQQRAAARADFHRALTPKGSPPMSLFVTADSLDPTEATPGQLLERRLHGIRAGEHGRGLMNSLRLWAASPTPANQAVDTITRSLTAEQRDPAMITAALYAVHAQHHAPPYGNAPLPRLMRAFGSGTSYGPRHPQTETLMQHMLAATRPRLLLPALTTLVRYAAAHDMTPAWAALADDLTAWSPATRERWAALFYTSQPLTEIGHHA